MATDGLVEVADCGCAACRRGEEHPEREQHRQLNHILARCDEQQRRWIAGHEAQRRGPGGIRRVADITGLHPETISRGIAELEQGLVGRPTDRVRWPGGGRPRVEKKIRHCRTTSLVS